MEIYAEMSVQHAGSFKNSLKLMETLFLFIIILLHPTRALGIELSVAQDQVCFSLPEAGSQMGRV